MEVRKWPEHSPGNQDSSRVALSLPENFVLAWRKIRISLPYFLRPVKKIKNNIYLGCKRKLAVNVECFENMKLLLEGTT